MTEPHLLIVDDARDIREPLGQYLRRHGYRTSLAENASTAREALARGAFDLVVLDIMMPGENGLSLTRELAGSGPPVILLTAMAEETDRIVGLEMGADDYVIKPFAPRELLARIRAVMRRASQARHTAVAPSQRQFGPWVHDPARRTVTRDGRSIALSPGENKLLIALIDRAGMVLTRDQLLDITEGREAKVFDRAIDNRISRLRRKIEDDPTQPALIVTEWGGGYRLMADINDLS